MITQETAGQIWQCYREIAAGNKLLEDLAAEALRLERDDDLPRLRDAFGHRRNLQLGIPSGENSHRIFDVHPDLAISIIRAHVAEKQAELARLNEIARAELQVAAKTLQGE